MASKINRFKEKIINASAIIAKVKNWPVYFLVHFKILGNKDVVYILRSGRKIKIKAGMEGWQWVFWEVFIGNSYNPSGFEIKKDDVVVDIGAHIGMFSVFASSLASKIYSIEPLEENFGLLKENIKINKAENIYPFRLAVSDKTGEKEIFINDSSFGHSFYKNDGTGKKIMVPTISLEDFIAQNNISKIDFMKLDCEGSEYDIFFNCSKRILSMIKKISMECHDIDSKRNTAILGKFLENNGFAVDIKPTNAPGLSYIFAKNKTQK